MPPGGAFRTGALLAGLLRGSGGFAGRQEAAQRRRPTRGWANLAGGLCESYVLRYGGLGSVHWSRGVSPSLLHTSRWVESQGASHPSPPSAGTPVNELCFNTAFPPDVLLLSRHACVRLVGEASPTSVPARGRTRKTDRNVCPPQHNGRRFSNRGDGGRPPAVVE